MTTISTECDWCGWSAPTESPQEAIEALAKHCLEVHPHRALEAPVVQIYVQRLHARTAPTNGGFQRSD